MRPIILIIATLLAGCATPQQGMLPVSSLDQATFSVDFERLAACSYDRISRVIGPGITKADLLPQGIIRIEQASGGIRYWEITFRRIGPRQTLAEVTRSTNMWGGDAGGMSHKLMPEIRTCAT